MANKHGTDKTLGSAQFALDVAAVKVDALGPQTIEIYCLDPDKAKRETVEVETFRILHAGFEEAVFFTCVDPWAPEGAPALYAAGEVAFGTLLPATRRCEKREDAAMEAVKFVLRVPADERSAAWERMQAFGAQWRAK